MANAVDLTTGRTEINTGWDDVVIEQLIRDIPGGRSLDVSELANDADVIYAGHIILKDVATGLEFKALKTTAANEYDDAEMATDPDWEVCGVLYRTIPKSAPLASIMTRGVVNKEAAVQAGAPDYEGLANIELVADLRLIEFVKH